MQIDNIATPHETASPEHRYASLHRAVERGMASQEVLRELVEICLQLDHLDEAKRIHSTMQEGPAREWVTSRLTRRGLVSNNAGPDSRRGNMDDGDPSLTEHMTDAIQYLCQGHMPAVALLTMLAFPIVVGVGGFLTAGGSLWLFAGLATLPGLCVLGVVGAMGRQIFLQSVEGEEEIPSIPAPPEMLALAKRHIGDVLIVLGVLVAPSLTLLWFEAPLFSSLPGLAIGMVLTPIALVLRQIRGDLGALSPIAMLRGIGASKGYSKVAGAFWLAFAPAALAFWSSLGHAIWLQIAIVGPLAVLPTFATARLLGTFTEVHKTRLGLLLHPTVAKPSADRTTSEQAPTNKKPTVKVGSPQGRTQAAAPNRKANVPAKAKPAKAAKQAVDDGPHLPPRPSTIAKRAVRSTPQPGQLAQKDGGDDDGNRRARKPARRIQGRAPAPSANPAIGGKSKAASPKANKSVARKTAAQKAAPQEARRQSVPTGHPAPRQQQEFSGPDLSGIPGARVINAEDRERSGASSRRR